MVFDAETLNPVKKINLPYQKKETRMVYVSPKDTIFVSTFSHEEIGSTYRYDTERDEWDISLPYSVWRMADDGRNRLFAGNYTSSKNKFMNATLSASEDDGKLWNVLYENQNAHHFHTLRWDHNIATLFAAFGDKPERGQIMLQNGAPPVRILATGKGQGHTDLWISEKALIWGSDDGSGRILRHEHPDSEPIALTVGWGHYMWFVTGGENIIFAGTVPSRRGERGAIVASQDSGRTWCKVLETPRTSERSFDAGVANDSRALSESGWLYFSSAAAGGAFRIKAISSSSSPWYEMKLKAMALVRWPIRYLVVRYPKFFGWMEPRAGTYIDNLELKRKVGC